MKIITDFVKPTAAGKFDADAAELIEAYKVDAEIIGAITVNVLAAEDDEAAEKLLAAETRAFQAAVKKAGFSARKQAVRDNGDGTHDILFSVGPKVERNTADKSEEAPAEEVAPVTDEADAEEVAAEEVAKAHKPRR